MDLRSSRLIVALAIAFSIIVMTMAYFGFRNTGRDLLHPSGVEESTDDQQVRYRRRYAQATHRDATREELRSLQKLRDLVQAKDRLLQQRTTQLKQATEDRDRLRQELQDLQRRHDQLQRENDLAVNAFVEFTSQVNDNDIQTAPAVREERDRPIDRSNTPSEVDVEIDLIQWQIEQANQRIAELEITALREIIRSTEATQTLVATGAAAVPALLDRLASQDPEVRQWAANVLGQIGPDASVAAEALLEVLNDENEAVRDAARAALNRIENRS